MLVAAVKSGWWKASELLEGEYGLISEVVSPAFVRAERIVATRELLKEQYPTLPDDILKLAAER
jgi:predicted cupin superfamily sugar epimerase